MRGSPQGNLSPYSLPFGDRGWIALSAAGAALAAARDALEAAFEAQRVTEVAAFVFQLETLSQSQGSEQSESYSISSPETVTTQGEELPVWIIPASPPAPPSSPVASSPVAAGITVVPQAPTTSACPGGAPESARSLIYRFSEAGGAPLNYRFQ